MKKLTKISLLLCIILFVIISTLTACNSSNDETTPDPEPTISLDEATEKSNEDNTPEIITDYNTDAEISTESESKKDDSATNNSQDEISTETDASNESFKDESSDNDNSSDNDVNNESSTDAPAHIHSFGDWETIKASSCTKKGEQQRSCTCGEIETRQLDMLSHTEVTDPAVKPTCTSDGLTEGSHCSVCHTVLVAQNKVTAKGHTTVIDEAVEATCTEDGLTAVNAHEGSALGPLTVGRARCQGYANAYQLCMWAVGVECYAITGVSGPDDIGHAWNITNLDGNYYLSDVTWDDIEQTSSGYAYFNVSSAEFPQHTTDAFWIDLNMPQCNKNDMSFFKINDAYIEATEDTKTEFLRIMDQYYPESNVINLKFESAEQYTATVDTDVLSQYVSEWARKHNIGFSYRIIKFADTNVLYLELIF